MTDSTKKTKATNALRDLVGAFAYYDRKDDEDLDRDDVRELVRSGEMTIEEMIEVFAKAMREKLGALEAK